jgi:hypothetical protein
VDESFFLTNIHWSNIIPIDLPFQEFSWYELLYWFLLAALTRNLVSAIVIFIFQNHLKGGWSYEKGNLFGLSVFWVGCLHRFPLYLSCTT